jgi:hypothetical protein
MPFVQAHNIEPQDVSKTLWALAKLDFDPDAASLAAMLAAAEKLLPRSRHEDQAQLVWAVCKLGVEPPPNLLPKLVQASWPLLPGMSYLSVWTLLACFANLQYVPPAAWVSAAAAAAARASAKPRVHSLPLRQRARMADGIMYALEQLGHLPVGEEGQHMWQQQLLGSAIEA